jgi:hypothetical protein
MKYFHLILVNLRRKKLRTALTAGSFLVALFLFGVLMIIRTALTSGVDIAGANSCRTWPRPPSPPGLADITRT